MVASSPIGMTRIDSIEPVEVGRLGWETLVWQRSSWWFCTTPVSPITVKIGSWLVLHGIILKCGVDVHLVKRASLNPDSKTAKLARWTLQLRTGVMIDVDDLYWWHDQRVSIPSLSTHGMHGLHVHRPCWLMIKMLGKQIFCSESGPQSQNVCRWFTKPRRLANSSCSELLTELTSSEALDWSIYLYMIVNDNKPRWLITHVHY